MAEKFQKKKLNRDDHKKVDNAVKYAKKGVAVLASIIVLTSVIKKNGPKIFSAEKSIITK